MRGIYRIFYLKKKGLQFHTYDSVVTFTFYIPSHYRELCPFSPSPLFYKALRGGKLNDQYLRANIFSEPSSKC